MKEFNYVPIYRVGLNEISQGIELRACDFCCKNCTTNLKCQAFYKEINQLQDGVYLCPFGFVASVFSDKNMERYIFTGLRLENVYSPKLADPKINLMTGNKNKFRKITGDELKEYQELYLEYKEGIEAYLSLKSFIEDILHDVRKFNGQLKGKSEILYRDSSGNKKLKHHRATIQNILATCGFMTLRLDAYDFMYNNIPMNATEKSSYNIYRIFDKVRHCLEERAFSKNLNIDVQSQGECGDIRAYDCIELLPYILLDNAIKYADRKSRIEVLIDDNPERCNIKVSSLGARLVEGEQERLFVRGFRGENAQRTTSEGLGIGLYTAKKICDLHNATINVSEKQGNNEKMYFVIDIRVKKE